MKHYSFFLLLPIFVWAKQALAQYGNIWAFGDKAGVDFNYSPPRPIETGINTNEGSATMCDTRGNLLFYTDGGTVWDRHHNAMPNGTDLAGVGRNITASTSQGALIIPWPGNEGFYYIFSLGSLESGYNGRLSYSIIDMSLNNGLGDIVAGEKGKIVATPSRLTEQMTAVYGNTCNVWLLVAQRSAPVTYAYNVDYRGVDTVPVVSERIQGGGIYGGSIGSMDVSPDRKKVAFAHGNLVLYDFDAGTGKLSKGYRLDAGFTGHYGVAFSPDNSKLYTATGSVAFQFDLSSNDTITMTASRLEIGEGWAVKRGPDDRIYLASGAGLSVVAYPDLAGRACNYIKDGLPLKEGTSSILGLPNQALMVTNKKSYLSYYDTIVCADSFLLFPTLQSGINYKWQDGQSAKQYSIDTSGIYWVTYQDYLSECKDYADTFHLNFSKNTRIYTSTFLRGLCKADTFHVAARTSPAWNEQWQDGSAGTGHIIRGAGVYWVTYQTDSLCASYADTFIAVYPDGDLKVSFAADTLMCLQDMLILTNNSPEEYTRFLWELDDGSSYSVRQPQHRFKEGGNYYIKLKGWISTLCFDTFSRSVYVDSVYPLHFVADRHTLCVGETVRFYPFADTGSMWLQWHFSGTEDMISRGLSVMQHAFSLPGTYPVTLKSVNRACPDTYFIDTIGLYPLPLVDLGNDIALCPGESVKVIRNRHSSPGESYNTRWSTGDTTASVEVRTPGWYSLTLTDSASGCAATGSVLVKKDCYTDIPNAFTPNHDGINDYFFPKQLLSSDVLSFTMAVFNRWGEQVFYTNNEQGKGWDGSVKGKEQPEGVYIYVISVQVRPGSTERYTGNLTLLR